MKIALINDTHFGARNDSAVFLSHQELFFKKEFFPYLKAHGITEIIHLGDLFDRRKYINFNTLDRVNKMFFEPLKEMGAHMEIIAGNHDVFFKDTNAINSLTLIAQQHDNITVHDIHPVVKTYGTINIGLVPWISKDNEEECLNFLKKTHADVIGGHFDIVGFEYMPGQMNHEGLQPKTFKRFDAVWSGHFHGKSKNGNIDYLGTQYEMTWADAGYTKGFHVYDTETATLEFVANPHKMFEKIYYDDKKFDYEKFDFKSYDGKYVKTIVVNKDNHFAFDRFIDKLQHSNPVDVSIVEDVQTLEDDYIVEDTQDTISILDGYIDQMEINADKNKLKKILRELHTEALAVE